MKSYVTSARWTLYAARAVAVLIIGLQIFFPTLMKQYHETVRPLESMEYAAIVGAFYASSLAALFALWRMGRLLRNIIRSQLFISENVRHINIIRWCCLAVSLICLVATIGFPSMLFLTTIMAFLYMSITVVGQVVKAGVAIREENDLTV